MIRSHRHQWTRAGALGVASLLLASACSGAPATPAPKTAPASVAAATPTGAATPAATTAATTAATATPAATAQATPSAAAQPVHFGVLRPFTGKYASVGTAAREGALTAAKAINDGGGVLGSPLTVDTADTLGDPVDAIPALNKLLSVDHAVGIIGPGGAEVDAVQPILDRSQIPFMFGGGSTRFDASTDPYFWRVTPSDSQLGVAMAVYAYKKGYRKAAMMFSTIESAQTLKDPVSATFKKLGGEIVVDVDLAPSQLSYRSEVLRVHNAAPDVIFSQMEPQTGAVVVSGFQQVGGLVPVVGSDIAAGADFIQAITPAVANQFFVALVGSSAPGEGTTSFASVYGQLYAGQDPPAGALYAYDATIVLALAVQSAGSTDAAKLLTAIPLVANGPGDVVTSYADGLTALKAGKDINFEGASGPMDFNEHHNVFGPFDAVQAGTDGKMSTVLTITPADLAAAAP